MNVDAIVRESELVKSFYLRPVDKSMPPPFEAGQHLPVSWLLLRG